MLRPTEQWANNFTIDEDDVDFLVNVLLEKETPLTSRELGAILVSKRLEDEAAARQAQYKDAKRYSPAESYEVGTKVVFPALEFATAKVIGVRDGNNTEYGAFRVITVDFGNGKQKHFAADYTQPHKLSEEATGGMSAIVGSALSADDIMAEADDIIVDVVNDALEGSDALVRLARHWFPTDLVLDIDEGHLNLAEAVLDISEGGPLTAEEIIEQIGGVSNNAPLSLQVFSLNGAMNKDPRFDEVGPTGEVLWYLVRMEPEVVQKAPPLLQYNPIHYDASIIDGDSNRLERDIADELSELPVKKDVQAGIVTLIYPHRRIGTLPLNGNIRSIFPYAQRTSKIYVALVDGADGQEYSGWVVPERHYIYGLLPLYNKHSIPVGGFVHVTRNEAGDAVVITFDTHRARTEWLPILTPKGDQITFENTRRSLGADYDEHIIIGVDDLTGVDALVKTINHNRRPLATILRAIIPELGKFNPQGTAHAKTIYSAVNFIRRTPPGPILATLAANPDFENMGGNYWRVADI